MPDEINPLGIEDDSSYAEAQIDKTFRGQPKVRSADSIMSDMSQIRDPRENQRYLKRLVLDLARSGERLEPEGMNDLLARKEDVGKDLRTRKNNIFYEGMRQHTPFFKKRDVDREMENTSFPESHPTSMDFQQGEEPGLTAGRFAEEINAIADSLSNERIGRPGSELDRLEQIGRIMSQYRDPDLRGTRRDWD